jgi:hypothetical protein
MSMGAIMAACFFAAMLATPVARADAACEKGYRDTTAVERQAMTNVLERAKAALPPAPQGWIIGGYEELDPIGRICIDVEGRPWAYGISRTFIRADDVAEREQLQADASTALRASAAEHQPRIDELMQKMQQLGAELAPAAQKGDQMRIDAINQELEMLQQRLDAVINDPPGAARNEALVTMIYQDREMGIGVSINPGWVADADLQSTPAPTGAHSALRGATTHEGITTATVVVLIGNWQRTASGGFRSIPRTAAPSTAAHAISVSVTADPGRLDALVDSIDFGALAALLR